MLIATLIALTVALILAFLVWKWLTMPLPQQVVTDDPDCGDRVVTPR